MEFLRLEDLAENEAEWWEPIEIDYRGHRVMVPPPPANSFPALVRLGMMSQVDVAGDGSQQPPTIFMSTLKLPRRAFWIRLEVCRRPRDVRRLPWTPSSPVLLGGGSANPSTCRSRFPSSPRSWRGDGTPEATPPISWWRMLRGTWFPPPRPWATPSGAGSCPREPASG